MDYLMSFLKVLGMFIIGLTAFRVMGSQSVGRLTDFDLVVVIAIGALVGDALADPELNPLIIIVAIGGLVLAQVITSKNSDEWIEKSKADEKQLKPGITCQRIT